MVVTGRRPLPLRALGLGSAPVIAAAAMAALGLGPPDVTSAVWLDAVPACGGSLLPTLGREAAMMVPMVGVALLGHGPGAGEARSWTAAALQIGFMMLLHLVLMLCDDVSRHAGSVALGRDLRAACLAGLAAASWFCRGRPRTASVACAAQCATTMATLMLTSSLPWSVAGVAPLAFLVARVVPDGSLREHWTSAFGLAGAVGVAGWG